MAHVLLSVFIDSSSVIEAHPIPDAPNIWIGDDRGEGFSLHLGNASLRGDDLRSDALAALDKLAAAVQAAMLKLAPERFPQPGPDDPDDDPTDEPATSDMWQCSCGYWRPMTGSYGCPDCNDPRPDGLIVNEGAGVSFDPFAPIVVHEPWGEGEGVVLDAATILRHGIEGQLRAAYGDR